MTEDHSYRAQMIYEDYADEHDEVERVKSFEPFIPTSLPDGIERGEPNSCAATAVQRALRHKLGLARGYALFETAHGDLVWIGHWWCIAPGLRAIDASWSEPGHAYIGERVTPEEIRNSKRDSDGSLVIEFRLYSYAPPLVVEELERMRAAPR